MISLLSINTQDNVAVVNISNEVVNVSYTVTNGMVHKLTSKYDFDVDELLDISYQLEGYLSNQ